MKSVLKPLAAAVALWFACNMALALTQAEHDGIVKDMDAAVQKYVVTPPPPPPPPVTAWPRLAPDLLDIDLTGPRAIIALSDAQFGTAYGGAKWLDPSMPGYDGKGSVYHYSDMAGDPYPASGPACDVSSGKGWWNWDCKFTNYQTCPTVKWGTESNGLRYLESCTDGSKEPAGSGIGAGKCVSCRFVNFGAGGFNAREIYWREAGYFYKDTWTNQRDIGIKLTGVGGNLATGGTFAVIFELGRKNLATGGWALQAYLYDYENLNSGIVIFPNVDIQPDRWYVFEGHVKLESSPGAGDGVYEFKVDGAMVYARSNVKIGATVIGGFGVQRYEGGTTAPAGLSRLKIAAIALSRKGWIGPPLAIGP